jgi:hypothetical protein
VKVGADQFATRRFVGSLAKYILNEAPFHPSPYESLPSKVYSPDSNGFDVNREKLFLAPSFLSL